MNQISPIPTILTSSNVSLLGVYLLFRRPVMRFLIYRVPGGRILRPYLMNMLRHNGLSASLLLASFAASSSVLLVLELVNCLADVYFTQPVSVASFSGEPRRTLLDGLQSKDPYIQRFAFEELRQLATTEEKKRIEVFTDIKGRSFENISKACLKELGLSYRTLQGRGRASAATGGSSASATSAPARANQGSASRAADPSARIPVTDENAFRPTQRTFLDSITQSTAAATAPISSVPPRAQEALSKASAVTSSVVAKVPAIFQQKMEGKLPEGVKEAAVTAMKTAKKAEQTVIDRWQSLTPETVKRSQYWRYLFEPLLRARVESALPNTDVDVCAIACEPS
jgi:nucleoporin NDC1